MRISDWSSDVCSADLREGRCHGHGVLPSIDIDLHHVILHLAFFPADKASTEKCRDIAVWTLGQKPVLALWVPSKHQCRRATGRPALGALRRDIRVVSNLPVITLGIEPNVPQPTSCGRHNG